VSYISRLSETSVGSVRGGLFAAARSRSTGTVPVWVKVKVKVKVKVMGFESPHVSFF